MYVEAAVTATLAAVAGMASITNRLHTRINHLYDRLSEMDRRVDGIELRIAEKYVSKADLAAIIKSMEDHMIRIENKLDQLTLVNK
tara:strand:- start:1232 stop:1489 length:258 start_codon:yes stop_codon:yes gene_type:complete